MSNATRTQPFHPHHSRADRRFWWILLVLLFLCTHTRGEEKNWQQLCNFYSHRIDCKWFFISDCAITIDLELCEMNKVVLVWKIWVICMIFGWVDSWTWTTEMIFVKTVEVTWFFLCGKVMKSSKIKPIKITVKNYSNGIQNFHDR